jgi:hypothetical protein
MEKFRISVYSDIEEVGIDFFEKINILRNKKIGDTYFITIENGNDTLTFSIHENYYNKVMITLRDITIDKILEK